MDGRVNGWSVLKEKIARHSITEAAIGEGMGIDSAELTALGRGERLMLPDEFAMLFDILKLSNETLHEALGMMISSRLAEQRGVEDLDLLLKVAASRIELQIERIPLLPIDTVREYSPALESLKNFVIRHTRSHHSCRSNEHACALRVDCENDSLELTLPPGSLLIVNSNAYPVQGELSLISGRDGRLYLKEFDRNDAMMRNARWIRPVISIEYKLHN